MTSSVPPVSLHESFDVARAAAAYREHGRVQILDALTPACAERVLACLESEVPWQLHFNDGAKSYDLMQEQVQSLPEANRVLLLDAINAKAETRFQYLFNNFPLTDAYAAGRLPELYIMRVLEFLNSAPFLDMARRLTGRPEIGLVDAQATLYRAGHFLTAHDDDVRGKGRVAAYVLNLTREWRADWGGVLNFPAPTTR
jgi:Rps23 Pro-64 3,4-dihydroxylase Tpa1-like proline 4-hydroxylase